MKGKLWSLVALVVLCMLPIAGCGGKSGGASIQTQAGYAVKLAGTVDTTGAAKATAAKALAAATLGTVTVYNAQDGSQLGTGSVDSDGKFANLSITMPDVKAVLVLKAAVAQGTFRLVLPIDLSNPPAGGLTSNNVSVVVNQDTTNVAAAVSASLGLTGLLGDTGMTLASVSKTYADAVASVTANGGQIISYSANGLTLSGSVSNAALLPALDAGSFTSDDLNNITLDSKIISAFIPTKNPVVNFQVTNKATGKGVRGLKTFGLHVAQLNPESNGSNSYWLNYVLNTSGNPAADPATSYNTDGTVKVQGYTVIDKGDGTYTAIFSTDVTAVSSVTYDATKTHRIGITVRSIATPGITATGPINPATGAVSTNFGVNQCTSAAYDFVPSSGLVLTDSDGKQSYARDIVTMAACNQCHFKLGFAGGHFASRPDTKICVMCHTPQNTSGEGDFTTFIHRIHMGEELPAAVKTEKVLFPNKTNARTTTLVTYGEQTYPQDIRNCTMCHKGADVSAWYAKPSRKACGSCHNNLDFAVGHSGPNGSGPAVTDDSACAVCHAGTAAHGGDKAHLPIAKPDTNSVVQKYVELGFSGYSAAQAATGAPGNSNTNAAYTVAASTSRLPVGANVITYVVSSVSRNTSKQPVIVFKFQKNGADVVFNDPAAKTEMMDGFVGSPSVYFAYSVPQDGIAAPADYNATASGYLRRIWNGTAAAMGQPTQAGTMTGPDGSGYYTVTLTGVTVPDNAKMLTGGIGYTYGLGSVKTKVSGVYKPFATTSMPLTQTDLAAYPYFPVAGTPVGIGGLAIPAPNVWKVASGYTGRRLIVDTAKCNACHGKLGVNPTFHAGQRNDAQTCTFCHNVNRVNSGWGVNIKEAVHAIHAGAKRVNKFSWEATAGDRYWEITYPGYLRDCEQCHIAGMYDYSNSVYTANNGALMNNLLSTTVATGTISSSAIKIVTGTETIGSSVISPWVNPGDAYGSGFSVTSAGVPTDAAGSTLVSSPISSACYACHDTDLAKAHMKANGGYLYEARSTALSKKETCLVCHGTAANTLNSTVPTIKSVHRWW